MSGNSIAIGLQGARQNWPEFLARLWPVVMYMTGLLFCRLLIEFGGRKKISPIATLTLGIEIAILLPIALISGVRGHVTQELQVAYVALLALAMGIQNAALTHFSDLTLHTGFVTGTLLKAAEHGAGYLTWLSDEMRRSGARRALSRSPNEKSFRHGLYLLFVWIMYVCGAAFGTFGVLAWAFRTLFVAIGGLGIVIAMDLKHPLAQKELAEQTAQTG
jgi:uncharacterized membrane protein YoaK (UPF0700 family)